LRDPLRPRRTLGSALDVLSGIAAYTGRPNSLICAGSSMPGFSIHCRNTAPTAFGAVQMELGPEP
jgi:hypothetical protein